jgi:hypothetical protein
MTGRSEVALTLLDSSFCITSEDDRMVELVRLLWEPFVSAKVPEGTPIEIDAGEDGWRFLAPRDPGAVAKDPWVFAAVLRNFLSRRSIQEASGIVPLHGAAVEREGAFLVLSGPPKAGKTTLMLELLARGWRLVTDDLVPLEETGGSARPFPKPLSIREPERWRRYRERWDVPEWLPVPAGTALIPATAFPRTEVDVYSPSALVFSRWEATGAPDVEALAPARAVALCAENLHLPAGPGDLGTLSALCAAVPACRIRYGTTESALELLEKCLAAPDLME